MRSKLVHMLFVGMLIGFVTLGTVVKPYSVNRDKWIDVLSFHWGVTQTQFARICLANTQPAFDTHEIEKIAFTFVQIENELGQTLIRREVPIPVNEFRCTDLTYRQLEDAGLESQPSGQKRFLLSVVDGTSNTQNSAQPGQLTGSIETVEGTGQTRIYQGLHWSFDNTEF